MGPCSVVIGHPVGDDAAGVVEAEEQRLVQEFVAHLRIEDLADPVLDSLTGASATEARFQIIELRDAWTTVFDSASRLTADKYNPKALYDILKTIDAAFTFDAGVSYQRLS